MSQAPSFIASRLHFRSRLTISTIAVSFFVIIISVAVASGFRREIRGGLSNLAGDIMLCSPDMNYMSAESSIGKSQSWLPQALEVKGVESIIPVVYRAGVIKKDSLIAGVMFKGKQDSLKTLQASIPSALAKKLGLEPGDKFTTYFVGEKTKARTFTVHDTYLSLLDASDKIIVEVPIRDLQRVNGWDEDRISAFEVRMDAKMTNRAGLKSKASELGAVAMMNAAEDDDVLMARSLPDSYHQIFDWLDLIDGNVYAILLLMVLVASFNMISGLLIFLFRNISTIGTLKTLGMNDREISSVFLKVGTRAVALGMLLGNVTALAFCLLQGATHFLKLNPANYFVSFVPVNLNFTGILSADAIAFAAILLLLKLPCIFISRVDPARTVRVK